MCSQASSSSEDVPWSSSSMSLKHFLQRCSWVGKRSFGKGQRRNAIHREFAIWNSGLSQGQQEYVQCCCGGARSTRIIAGLFKFCTDKVLNVWPVYRLGCDQVVWCGGQRCFLDVPFHCIGSPSANQLDGF